MNLIKPLLNREARRNLLFAHRLFNSDPNYSIGRFVAYTNKVLRGRKFRKNRFTFGVPPLDSAAFRSFLLTAKSRDAAFTDLVLNRKRAPDIISLAVTARCPNDCVYCSLTDAGGEELTTGEWVSVVHQAQELGSCLIEFTGGEPLTRTDLEDIIRSVDERSRTLVATSGQGFTPVRARSLKAAGLDIVMVSLDSPDLDKNALTRGPELYGVALEAIKNALSMGLYTVISALLPRQDISEEHVFRLCSFAEGMGADELLLVKPIPAGKLRSREARADLFFDHEALEFLESICSKASRRFHKLNICSTALMECAERTGCAGGAQLTHISSTGELFPCDFLPLSFGNVLVEPLTELWPEMNEVMGIPKRNCMCYTLMDALLAGDLPIARERSVDLCGAIRETEYPGFYRSFLEGRGHA